MFKKSLLFFSVVVMLWSCGSSRFVPVQPVKPNTDWSVKPWAQTDREFEKPYENPREIYKAFTPQDLNAIEVLESSKTKLNISPIVVENEAVAVENVTNSAKETNLEIASVLSNDVAHTKASLSQKQLKKVNKIERKLDKRFNHKRGDGMGFDWTKLAIIIAIVGGAALVVFLATGWFFGLFLFILAGAALICKWTGILDF